MADLPNGHAEDMAPSDYVDFIIGGQPVRVKTPKFLDLEKIRDTWWSLNAEDGWIINARKYLRMVAIISGRSEDDLASALTAGEALDLGIQFNELLTKAGIIRPEAEAATENPGTGTLTPSSQTSQSEASVVGIQSESDGP